MRDHQYLALTRNNDKNKGTKVMDVKSGRRSRKFISSTQDQLSSYPFQLLDHQLKDVMTDMKISSYINYIIFFEST